MDCKDFGLVSILAIIKRILGIIQLIVPIILILSCIWGLIQLMLSPDDKKKLTSMRNKVLAAVICIFLPALVTIVLSWTSTSFQIGACWENAEDYKKQLDEMGEYQVESSEKEKHPLDYSYDDFNFSTPDNESSSGSGTSSSIEVDYPDDVIENLASFIMREAGGHKDGFLGQLMTGAVFMNNLYYHDFVSDNSQINKNTMCELFSHGSVYSSNYCNYTFSRMPGTSDEQKKQLTTVAKIILSKNFTIPKYVLGEGLVEDWGEIGILWGNTQNATSYQEFSYSEYFSPLEGVDIYGRTVSTDYSTYITKATELYNQYMK